MAKKVKSLSLSFVIAFAAFAFFPLSSVVKRETTRTQAPNSPEPLVEVQDGGLSQEIVLFSDLNISETNGPELSNRYSTAIEMPVITPNKRAEIHAIKTQEIATDRR